MGLYLVPAGADITDPVTAGAVARFKLRLPKPEALTGTSSGNPILSDATIALHLEAGYDAVRSAVGDRMTEGATLVQVDAVLDAAAMSIAALSLYLLRGLNRQEGSDSTIEAAGATAQAYLARCRPGQPAGKQENPRFVTSDTVTNADAPVFTSALGGLGGSATSDAFIEARSGLPGSYGGSYPCR